MTAPDDHHRLTWRQEDVARLLAEGRSPAEIAEVLTISLDTVRMHIRRLHAIVGTHSLHTLALWSHAHLGCCIRLNCDETAPDQT